MSKAQDELNEALSDELDEMFTVSPGLAAHDADTGDVPVVDDKADWVEIWIDEVEGLPNFEVVQGNGVLYQIKRGLPVSVPPIVCEILRLAIKTTYKMMPHPTILGKEILHPIVSSAIPWRKV